MFLCTEEQKLQWNHEFQMLQCSIIEKNMLQPFTTFDLTCRLKSSDKISFFLENRTLLQIFEKLTHKYLFIMFLCAEELKLQWNQQIKKFR